MAEHGAQNVLKPLRPTAVELQNFLQCHLTLLKHERLAELEESHLLLSSVSPRTLEVNGLALTRLGMLSESIGAAGKRIVELHRPIAYHAEVRLPPNTFRSGDVVALLDEAAENEKWKNKKQFSGKAIKYSQREGVVVKVSEVKIAVAISAGRKSPNGDASGQSLPQRICLVKIANEVTWERMEKNLVRLAQKLSVPVRSSRGIRGGPDDMLNLTDDASSDEESSNLQQHVAAASKNAISSEACLPAPLEPIAAVPPLLAVLLALAPPSPLPRTLEPPPLPLFNVDLNESQRTALSRALAANELHLIHGPPGTGKTTLLVELVMQLVVGRGERVLVTGSSNLAVDNLGIRLVAFGSGKGSKSTGSIKCCRIGHPARILPALGSHTLDYLSSSSSAGQILSDVRKELQSAYSALHSPNPWTSVGNKSSSQRGTSSLNNKRLTGSDRRKAWEEVRELRKELKQRERGLFTTTLGEANVVLSTLHGAASGMLEKALRAGKPAEHVADSRQKRKFDTIIIDEACQAIEASTWGAVLDTFDETRGGRLILAGDDQQLGPVVKSEKGSETKSGLNNKAAQKKKDAVKEKKDRRAGQDRAGSDHISNTENLSLESSQNQPMRAAKLESEEELSEPLKQQMGEQPQNIQRKRLTPPRSLSTTLFTRILKLYGSSPTIRSLLTVQYRMNEAIMAFPNHEMYGGKLIAHESCKNRCLGDGSIPSWKAVDTDAAEDLLGGRVVFYDTAGAELYETTTGDEAVNPLHTNSKSNSHEVELVHGHVRRLLDNGLDASSITLLAPYSAQVSALAARFPASEYPGIEIGTIDALQGREQDVVIISLVRSNEEREIGFLNEKKRLNVAMTRAKRQLVVVGDSDTIRGGGGYLARWMTWLGEHAAVEPILS